MTVLLVLGMLRLVAALRTVRRVGDTEAAPAQRSPYDGLSFV
jgi:hypothetical protein